MEAANHILSVEQMPTIPGVKTPDQFYTVLNEPALLAGMCHPNQLNNIEACMTALAHLGFTHIICLTDEHPMYPAGPLNRIGSVELEDLYGCRYPRDEQANRRKILEMAHRAVECLRRGEGVVVHCGAGIGRTGTVLGAILVKLGFDPQQVITELMQLNRARKCSWPESPWQKNLLLTMEV